MSETWLFSASKKDEQSANAIRKRIVPALRLLACSFCTAVYHNSEACLGEAWVANEALAKSASFPWACPACFKKGVTAVQRAALKPTGQRAAGAKKSRKKRAKKK